MGINGKSLLNLLKFGKIGYQTRMGNSDKAHDNMVWLRYLLIDIDSFHTSNAEIFLTHMNNPRLSCIFC